MESTPRSTIGLELTRILLNEGWQVIGLNRSDWPADDRKLQSAALTGQLRTYKTSDLSDFASLRQALEQMKANEDRVDVLFNNAGRSFPELEYSRQGREIHYELMTVVPYILTMELKPLLNRGRLKTVRKGKRSGLPFWLMPIMKLFFSPPTHGAGQLYAGALGKSRGLTGVYLNKGQVAEIKFREHAQTVLNQVRTVYETEYLRERR